MPIDLMEACFNQPIVNMTLRAAQFLYPSIIGDRANILRQECVLS